jgi:hypothetical protein
MSLSFFCRVVVFFLFLNTFLSQNANENLMPTLTIDNTNHSGILSRRKHHNQDQLYLSLPHADEFANFSSRCTKTDLGFSYLFDNFTATEQVDFILIHLCNRAFPQNGIIVNPFIRIGNGRQLQLMKYGVSNTFYLQILQPNGGPQFEAYFFSPPNGFSCNCKAKWYVHFVGEVILHAATTRISSPQCLVNLLS